MFLNFKSIFMTLILNSTEKKNKLTGLKEYFSQKYTNWVEGALLENRHNIAPCYHQWP